MNGEATLYLVLPALSQTPRAFLRMGFVLLLLGLAATLYDRPHPFWDNPGSLLMLLMNGLTILGLYQGSRPYQAIEFLMKPSELTLRTWRLKLLGQGRKLMEEATIPVEAFRYLESQHGVILKGPAFHRDLILPKDQTRELIEWLQGIGIQRFSLDETRR